MIGRVLRLFGGQVKVKVTGSSLPRFLNVCALNGIALHRMKKVEWNELYCSMSIKDFRRLRSCMGRTGCRVHIVKRSGLPFTVAVLRPRCVLWGGFIVMLMVCWVLCTHIWCIEAHIDNSLSEAEIMRDLSGLGVKIGARRSALNVGQLRWRMMQLEPNISFLALNIQGNMLTVEARGRTDLDERLDEDAVIKVVASKDGVIKSMRVQNGQPSVKPGDAVKPGDTLISSLIPPASEKGSYRLTHARGRIEAYTAYHLQVLRALETEKKRYTGKEKTQYALVIGNKRLNLYFGSGISGATCDKIVETKTAWISESVVFPVSLIVQKYKFYETSPETKDAEDVKLELISRALGGLASGMDGMITGHTESVTGQDGAAFLEMRVDAAEQIGEEALDDTELPSEPPGEEEAGAQN